MAQITVETPAGIESKRPRLTWWKRAVMSSILVLMACLAGYHMGGFAAGGLTANSAQRKLEVVNGLVIDARSLELGEVWETPFHSLTLPVRNVSSEERRIADFSGSCGCLTIEPKNLTIPPGGTAELSVTLDLTHRLPYQIGVAQWPTTVRFNPVFQGDFASTPGWELKAKVRSRVGLDTLRITFADQCVHAGPGVTRKVRAKGYVPLQRLEALAVPPIADIRVESVPDTADSYVIFVSPHSNLPVGPFKFEVQVRAVTPEGVVHTCASIEATGEMQSSTEVFPRLILLGEHPLSEETRAEISVRLPAAGWKIDHIATDSDTVVTQTDITAESSWKLHVAQKITQPGDQVRHISIVVRKPDNQTEILEVEARYHGMPRAVSSKTHGPSLKLPLGGK